MSICTDNSTECLLRAILDTQSGFNWNPPTFVITLLIGVLALFVALATVFQGLLFAGPGRLKATWRAVGPWSKYTTTTFSWTELRFRTTTWVPYIALTTTHADFDFDRQGRSKPYLYQSTSKLGCRRQKKKLTNDEVTPLHLHASSFAAGWLNLLNGLSRTPHFKTIKRDTEHIPPDIYAVPAFGTIETLVKLAALAGCDVIEMVNGLPFARGLSSQLGFREHPLLGTICVYQQFPPTSTYRKLVNIHHTSRDLSPFNVPPKEILHRLHMLTGACNHQICGQSRVDKLNWPSVYTADGSPERTALALLVDAWYPRAIPFEKLGIRRAIRHLCAMNQPIALIDHDKVASTLAQFLQSKSKYLLWHISKHEVYFGDRLYGLFIDPVAGAPEIQDAIDEFMQTKRSDALVSEYFESSWLPALAPSESFAIPQRRLHLQKPLGCVDFSGSIPLQQRLADAKITLNAPSSISSASTDNQYHGQDGNLVILPLAFITSLNWLGDNNVLARLDFDQKSLLRAAFAHQIEELDFWLLNYAAQESACAVLNLVHNITQGSTGSTRGSKMISGVAVQSLDEYDLGEILPLDHEIDDGVRVLLLFRAVLCAALCATAADTSCVEGTELGQRVVQVL